ncbi:DUF1062 domain-containing protein [Gorillibacterium sp. CAU 1737]|uniref:DUF1062 domain-containing protein n=1 Tax=Gorillibacterium sp. CAU 1737 TaxID=3140362 RepID=UPI00326166F9
MLTQGIYRCEAVAEETPTVHKPCRRCKRTTAFRCSEKFRMNAQQKHLDVWLIYKCTHCDSTWNHNILSRVHSTRINRELQRQFEVNDRETAWRYAFEVEKLRKVTSKVETALPYHWATERIGDQAEGLTIHLSSRYPFDLRVDKALRELLDLSRSKLEQMAEDGLLHFPSPQVTLKTKLKAEIMSITLPSL